MVINRYDLDREIAHRAEMKIGDVKKVLDVFEAVVKESVIDRDKISLVGFLEIDSKEVEAQPRVNPMTGENIVCEEYVKPTVRFKYSFKKTIKEETKGNIKPKKED